ncbi:MAG: hypothetical protein OXJ53_22050 [Gammaproteobacteria bacterium]|nr:hypothetical protein [Gammaproteobacteria bacterium]MDE0271907.1 hypothetical protein [Gammaproteobacteria bacterium]
MTYVERICQALSEAGVHYALVGGYAVALHGAPRGTIDIDLALHWTLEDLTRAERALKGIGLVSSLPVTAQDIHDYRNEYIKERNLVAWNFHNPDDPLEQVDIIIAYDLSGKKTKPVELSMTTVHILSIDDLIAMKQQSGRAQDIEDAAALEKLR